MGSFPPPPSPEKEPKALVQPWVAPRWGSSSVPVPRISSVFQHEAPVEMGTSSTSSTTTAPSGDAGGRGGSPCGWHLWFLPS